MRRPAPQMPAVLVRHAGTARRRERSMRDLPPYSYGCAACHQWQAGRARRTWRWCEPGTLSSSDLAADSLLDHRLLLCRQARPGLDLGDDLLPPLRRETEDAHTPGPALGPAKSPARLSPVWLLPGRSGVLRENRTVVAGPSGSILLRSSAIRSASLRTLACIWHLPASSSQSGHQSWQPSRMKSSACLRASRMLAGRALVWGMSEWFMWEKTIHGPDHDGVRSLRLRRKMEHPHATGTPSHDRVLSTSHLGQPRAAAAQATRDHRGADVHSCKSRGRALSQVRADDDTPREGTPLALPALIGL